MTTGSRPFDIERIQAGTFVRCLEFHDELPSTNDRALELAGQKSIETPLLVLATRQTSGRGRGANRWWSAAGGLTFSLILDSAALSLPAHDWPKVSLTAGVAVCEALRDLLPPVEIGLKWPNDVYLQWRKVSGILVEASSRCYGKLVVGIGINVNNSFPAVPADVRSVATSLSDVAHCYYDLSDVLIRVLNQLAQQLNWLQTGDPRLVQRWQAMCLLRGRTVRIEAGSRRASGRCQGIDADGALRIESHAGPERFFAGTVSQID